MKIKRNAAFKLFAYGKNKDKYQIRLRVTFNSQRIDLGTGCQIALIDAWDERIGTSWLQGAKGRNSHYHQ